jgi:elongation factor P
MAMAQLSGLMVMSCLSNEARVSYPIVMLTGLKLVETSGGWIVPIEYSEVRKGMVIVGEDKQLYTVVDRNLHTPGNWRAILTLKMKNLNTGAVTINRFKPEDKVEQAYLDNRPMQYLYKEGDDFVFSDMETFDTYNLHKDWVGDTILYLKENDNCTVVLYEGKPISLELPATIDLKVIETEPSLKGATAAAQHKPATLETGLKVNVPAFIGAGEIITVDTRTGEYMSRKKD